MNLIPNGIVKRLYESANIMRWNDHIRPVDLSELDKQAHKTIIAFILAKFEETFKEMEIDWIKLIEGAIFEFLHRVVLTDIKPPVFHKMMAEKGTELNNWVIDTLKDDLLEVGDDFFEKFKQYWFDKLSWFSGNWKIRHIEIRMIFYSHNIPFSFALPI